jgi:hypothetical protein
VANAMALQKLPTLCAAGLAPAFSACSSGISQVDKNVERCHRHTYGSDILHLATNCYLRASDYWSCAATRLQMVRIVSCDTLKSRVTGLNPSLRARSAISAQRSSGTRVRWFDLEFHSNPVRRCSRSMLSGYRIGTNGTHVTST